MGSSIGHLPLGRTRSVALEADTEPSSADVVVCCRVPGRHHRARNGVQHSAKGQHVDLAITYTSEGTKKANTSQHSWLQGGSIQLGADFYRGLGVVADVTGTHTGSIGGSGVPFSEVTVLFGPRYRVEIHHKVAVYGEALIGEANAFDSVLPAPGAAQQSENSLAFKLGGGIDYRINHRYSIRALDASYIRMQFQNSTNNQQDDLRLSVGLVMNFGR